MLPGLDGVEVCKRLRTMSKVPVIMLTAKDGVGDRVSGLDCGADDYLTKPFATEELLARIRAVMRRKPQEGILTYADLWMDQLNRVVKRGERQLDLRAKEFDLLRLFMQYPEQVLSREFIFDKVWGYDFIGESNVIEVYIRYLRSKLEDGNTKRLDSNSAWRRLRTCEKKNHKDKPQTRLLVAAGGAHQSFIGRLKQKLQTRLNVRRQHLQCLQGTASDIWILVVAQFKQYLLGNAWIFGDAVAHIYILISCQYRYCVVRAVFIFGYCQSDIGVAIAR